MVDGWWWKIENNIFEKEGDYYELWRFWRTICTGSIKGEIK